MNEIKLPKCNMVAEEVDNLRIRREALREKLLNGDSILFEDESNKIEEERHRLIQEFSSNISARESITIDYDKCYDILYNRIKIVIGDSVPFHRQESITLLELNDKYDFSLSQVCGFIAGTIHIVLYFYSDWPKCAFNDNSFQIESPSSYTYEYVLSDMLGRRSWGDGIKLMIGDKIIKTKDLGKCLLENSTISIDGWSISFYFIIRHIREYLGYISMNHVLIPNSGGDFGGWRWFYNKE